MEEHTGMPGETKRRYPNYIRYYLKQQGYTARELAERTGISRRSLTDYLGGVRPVPRASLKKIARTLRCSIQELVPEPDLMPKGRRVMVQNRRETGRRHPALLSSEGSIEPPSGPLDLFEIGLVALALAYRQQGWSSEEFHARFEEAKRRITAMVQQQTGEEKMTRRQALTLLAGLPVALLGLSQEGSQVPLFAEELLPLCATSIPACWELYFDGSRTEVERVLPIYLSRLTALAQQSSPHQKIAAGYASQVYQLACELAKEQESFGPALNYCKQAFLYAELAEDPNLQIATLIRQSMVYFHRQYLQYTLQSYQKALPLLSKASPLLQGRVYTGLADTYAKLQQKDDALNCMGLAHDTYPAHPEVDQTFLYTRHSHFSLYVHGEGLTYLYLDRPKEAWQSFARIEAMLPKTVGPRQVELLIHQATTSVALGDLEQSCFYVKTAAEAAEAFGSPLRYNQAFDIYQRMADQWSQEKPVKALAELFHPW